MNYFPDNNNNGGFQDIFLEAAVGVLFRQMIISDIS